MNSITIDENINKVSEMYKDQKENQSQSSNIISSAIYFTKGVLKIVKQESPILYWVGILSFVVAICCIGGYAFDDRMLMGINVWMKPLKFSISIGIYIMTVGYLVTLYPYSKRKKWIINGLTAWTLILELGIIVSQGARGVMSHYNNDSAYDAIVFIGMGILIGINVLIMVVFIIDTIRLKMNTPKSIQWSILLGWVIVLFGSWVGGQMIGQMSHSVGTLDGGDGLPFLNWSTIAGDLRVAHFFGLHAIQVIPIFAFILTRKWTTSLRNQILVITAFALIYASWIGFTFFQAKQGMALIGI